MTAAIDAIVAAFYAAFDNRDGRVPDGAALLALFAPQATVTRVSEAGVECWPPDAFVLPRIALLTGGDLRDFHEWETGSSTRASGPIAARWSRYRKAGRRADGDFAGGGEKLFQLYRTGDRWRIAAILWRDEG